MPTDRADSPERIAHYRLEWVAAQGGMGIVYRATDELLGRPVALKVIAEPTQGERLIREAQMVSKLTHPHIAGVYQAGFDDATQLSFIAFEWVEGSTLRSHLRQGPLPLEALLRYTRDISDAVAHAHQAGLVHGDLKADNVVVAEGRLKLLDFGLSAPAEELTQGDLWGTPAYMAPELLAGAARSTASDLFALGVLLYEMATGVLPYGGEDGDERSVARRQKELGAVDARERRPDLPTRIADVVRALLRPDPSERGPSATELERFARLELRTHDHPSSARWWIPTVGVLLLVVMGWIWRDSIFRPESSRAERVAPAPPTVFLRVGTWRDAHTHEETDETRFARDLLTLHLNGDDPGSALIEAQDGAGPGRIETVDGTWGGGAEGWAASWVQTWGDGATIHVQASDPVALARRVAEEVLREPVVNLPATTLTENEQALVGFIGAVRAADEGRFREARDAFVAARRQAGSFPEAASWETALLLVEGEFERAVAAHRDVPSAPGRVLADALGIPVRRPARWPARHRLARLVGLIFDAHDPRTPDSQLREALARDGQAGLPYLPYLEARLALVAEDVPTASDALLRYQALGGPEAYQRLLERWLLRVQGQADAGDELLNDWLLAVAPRDPGAYLRVPFLVYKGKVRAAVRSGRRKHSETGEARQEFALALAIAGHFADALQEARQVSVPLDPGRAHRLAAAIEGLRGDLAEAEQALRRAREIDPERAETRFLLEYLRGDPYRPVIPAPAEGSAFQRWRSPFDRLGEGRAQRLAGDPARGLAILGAPPWVSAGLEISEWPETCYLIGLERVACLWASGATGAAEREMQEFREGWPRDRTESSRVSVEAARVDALLETRPDAGQ